MDVFLLLLVEIFHHLQMHYLRQFQVSCTKEEYAAKLLKILNVEVESLPRVANALTKEISSEALDKVEKELDAAINEMLDEGMA